MSIPKTSSGKIQRRACKNAFLEGTIEVVGQWNAKGITGVRSQETLGHGVASQDNALHSTIPQPKQKISAETIQAWLVTRIAAILELDSASIDPRQPFTYYGLGSVQVVSLTGDLEVFLNRTLAPTLAWDYPTIELLANYLASDSQPVKTAISSPVLPQPSS